MTITIRPAVEADQSTIEAFTHLAKLNPRNLHWEHFLIAEENGKIVGIRQVRHHKYGTREVASGFVLPEYRRQGPAYECNIRARESSALFNVSR